MKVCKYKHNAPFYKNGQCSVCSNEATARARKKHLDKYRENDKNRQQVARDINKEQINARRRETYKQSSTRRIYCKSSSAKRRAIKKNALVKWANLDIISKFYSCCPKGYQVDHIIPLQNDLVCGLHVENNLQYLTKEENLSKGNKFIPIF